MPYFGVEGQRPGCGWNLRTSGSSNRRSRDVRGERSSGYELILKAGCLPLEMKGAMADAVRSMQGLGSCKWEVSDLMCVLEKNHVVEFRTNSVFVSHTFPVRTKLL